MTLPSPHEWLGEHLRASFFGDLQAVVDAGSVWEGIFGSPPETRTNRPAESAIVEEGNLRDYRIVVQVVPARIDIVLQPQFLPTFPNIGQISEALSSFIGLIGPAIEKFSAANRMALGGAAVLRVDDVKHGYATLQALLPEIRVNNEMKDLFFQINYPGHSKVVEGNQLNRLGKWFAGKSMMLAISPNSGSPVSQTFGSFVRAEFDINTDPENPISISPETARDLWIELADEASKIVFTGTNR